MRSLLKKWSRRDIGARRRSAKARMARAVMEAFEPRVLMSTTLADWTFETSQPVTAGPFNPEIGAGSALGHHAGASTYSTPAGNGSSHSFSSNTWAVGDYYQFSTSSIGAQGISISFDQNGSGTGPGNFKLQYSTDGTNFTDLAGATYTLTSGITWAAGTSGQPTHETFDLSSITALNNDATIAFRIVDTSTVSVSGGAVGTSGTDRVDNVVIAAAFSTPAVTASSSAVTDTTATLGGNVTSDGGSTVTARGVVYALTSADSNPTIGDGTAIQVADSTGGTGTFAESITGLTASSNYTFAAYATNSYGTTYTDATFATSAPVVTSPSITSPTSASITYGTATLGGNITANGGATITASGIVYALTSTDANPQIGDAGTTVVSTSPTATGGVFTVPVTGLTASSNYSFTAYATNSAGTTYTTAGTFSTSAPPTIAAIEAAGSGTFTISNATITAILSNPNTSPVNGLNYTNWSFDINDGTGSLDVFGAMPSGGPYTTPTVGDVISVTGTYAPYDAVPELGTITAISKTGTATPAAPVITTIPAVNNANPGFGILGYQITIKDVTIGGLTGTFGTSNLTGTITDGSSNSMTLYYWPTSYSVANTNLFGMTIPTGPQDITGFVNVYGGVAEFDPMSMTPTQAAPTITGLSPNAGPLAGGTTVTISGSSFTSATGATFNGSSIPFTFVNDSTITIVTPAYVSGSQSVNVTVTNPLGTTAPASFAYTNLPTVASLNVVGGPLAGGNPVTITGSSLNSVTAVNFGGTIVTSITHTDDEHLTVNAPGGAAGIVLVTVTSPGGTSANVTNNYTYLNAPTIGIGGLNVTTGPSMGGTTVVITGTNFQLSALGGTTVTFGGVAAASVTVNSATQLTVVTPVAVSGTADVVVTTLGGSATDAGAFTVTPTTIAQAEALTGTPAIRLDSATLTVTDILSFQGSDHGKAYTTWSFLVNDGTGSAMVYGYTNTELNGYSPAVGDIITINGKWSPYNQIPEIVSIGSGAQAITLVSSGNPVPAPLNATISDVNTSALPLTLQGYEITLKNVSISGLAAGTFGTSNLTGTITDGAGRSMELYYYAGSYALPTGNMYGQSTTSANMDITGWVTIYKSGSTYTPEFNPVSMSPTSETTLSTTTLTSSGNPAGVGSPVTFTATVTASATGTVQFMDGTTLLGGPVALNGSGVATYTTSALTTGTHTITAVYSGDNTYYDSKSLVVSQVINASLPGWLYAANPSDVTWNQAAETLEVNNAGDGKLVEIVADPSETRFNGGTGDLPVITVDASATLLVNPIDTGDGGDNSLIVHIGGLRLQTGATVDVKQQDAPSAGDLANGEFVASNHASNHLVLVVGTLGGINDPIFQITATNAKLDMEDNDLVIHTGSLDEGASFNGTSTNFNTLGGYDELGIVQGLAATGRDGGDWNGKGLTSSVASNQDNSDGIESVQLGVVNNTDLPTVLTKWTVGAVSENLGANDIIVKYTYTGDFNLDGKVNTKDSAIFGAWYDNGGSTGNEWAFGDTNGDGLLNTKDSAFFGASYNNGTALGTDIYGL